MSLTSYLQAMPKVELHIHLEGATQPETLLMLAERNGVKLPADTVEDLRRLYVFRDFHDFLKIYLMIIQCLRTADDFSDLAYRHGAEMARQNIRYAEITWTPQTAVNPDLPFEEVLEAVNDGRMRAKSEWGVEMRWIPDIVRNVPEYAPQVAAWCSTQAAMDGGIVALGLGGLEAGYPPELFAEYFEAAANHGLPANPHAGEIAGPESVWGALNVLKAVRIGHGVRAIEDAALVAYLAENQTPLEVNPTSNLCLQVYPSYEAHPLKALLDAGCLVTINSDDPPLFNTTLTDEYRHAVSDCGLTIAQLEKTVLDALRVSYLDESTKTGLISTFEADFTRLRGEHDV